jgi:hypothetical protein
VVDRLVRECRHQGLATTTRDIVRGETVRELRRFLSVEFPIGLIFRSASRSYTMS